jgi:hypothetical protein
VRKHEETGLEKRCRRVVRLLPRAERDARGDEVLGVLMDLSTGRTRPPLAEVVAVAGLSLRLRLAARAARLVIAAPVLVATLLLVVAPWPVGAVIRVVLPHASTPVTRVVEFAALIGLWLAGGAVWLLGLRRVATALWLVFAGATLIETARGLDDHASTWYLTTVTLPVLITAATLVVAVRRGVPAPQPRWAWLLLMLGTAAGWAVTLALPPSSRNSPVTAVVATTVAVLACVLVVTGTTRSSGVMPAVVVAVLTLGGWTPAWVGLALLTAMVGTLISRRADRIADQSPLSTGVAT